MSSLSLRTRNLCPEDNKTSQFLRFPFATSISHPLMSILNLSLPFQYIFLNNNSLKPISVQPVPPLQVNLIRSRGNTQFKSGPVFSVGKEETELQLEEEEVEGEEEEEEIPPSEEDLQYVAQIKRVLELLRKNRDMTFGEVKLTIMIEDPRDIERKRMLGIEDPDEVTRDDLASALEDVHEGLVPRDRLALRVLAEEMNEWPDLEVEAPKTKPRKSLYAKATDTGIDPLEAAKRLNIDWDSAADIEEDENDDDMDVPPAVGYSALYLVTGLPIIIGVSVVLILFYNSLQ